MSSQARHSYEFGPFRVDAAERRLLREGQPVALPPKAFETLLALVQNSGHLLTKDELLKSVWHGTFVEENNLAQHISAIRRALSDEGNGHGYIETVPRLGYRFTADVQEFRDDGERLLIENHTGRRAVVKQDEREEETGRQGKLGNAETPSGAQAGRRRVALSPAKALALAVLVGLAAVLFILVSNAGKSEGNTGHKQAVAGIKSAVFESMAVLPFKTISAGGDEHIGTGMADALIARLSPIKQVSVRPLSAVQRYAGAKQDPLAAGRELGVDAILDGSVQREGGRVKVIARLLRVRDGSELWTAKFEEDVDEIFALQDSIAWRVASDLPATLTGDERERLARRPTRSPKAYEAYLKGRFHWSKRAFQNYKKSLEYFEQAVGLDPDFALAYSGLADAHSMGGDWQKAEAYALKALELDDGVAEAHASLGFFKMFWRRNWDGAELELSVALKIDPNYSTARQWYALLLAARGRNLEATAEMQHALELDPFSVNINADLCQIFLLAREYDRAIAQCRKALDIEPDFILALSYLRDAYALKGMEAEAVEVYLKHLRLEESNRPRLAHLSEAANSSGLKGLLRAEIELLLKKYPRDWFFIAKVYALLGEQEKAIVALEKSVEAQEFHVVFLKADPVFDVLRDDPRYADLLRRMNLAT